GVGGPHCRAEAAHGVRRAGDRDHENRRGRRMTPRSSFHAPRAATETASTLDPADWEEFRALAHVALDDAIDYVRTVRERPVWRSPPPASREFLSAPLPRAGSALADVYAGFRRHVLPYPTGNIHPRFWGWVMGNGTPVGLLADLLTSAMNSHVSGYDQ